MSRDSSFGAVGFKSDDRISTNHKSLADDSFTNKKYLQKYEQVKKKYEGQDSEDE